MKIKILLLVLTTVMVSCIKNDIPYPHVNGEVLGFEVKGQSEVTINNDKHLITLVLSEDVNPRTAEITTFDITPNATSTLSIESPIDLSQTVEFTISTYQDYAWTIETTQSIERDVLVDNQVGAAVIDPVAKSVLINISSTQSLGAINVKKFKLAPSVATYSPDPMRLTNFSKPVKVTATCWGVTEEWTITITKSSKTISTLAAEPWGGFAHLNGSILEGSAETASFEYRAANSQNWLTLPATVDGASMTARLTGLTGATKYIYRAKLGEDLGDEVEFTTEETPLIPNLNLDEWTLKGKTWFANSTAANTFWATGNEGVTAAIAGGKDSNTFPTEDAVRGKAACVTTISAPIVDLAAGSLFTGNFKLDIFKPLDSPRFSRDYTGRPTKLSFWYKYTPKVINIAKKRPELLGTIDKCNLYIYLGDWQGDLTSSKMQKELTEGIIAYGSFETDQDVQVYIKQTIDIKYFDTTRRPTKVIIVATSSILGEQYIGGVGSTMFVDELEFSFD